MSEPITNRTTQYFVTRDDAGQIRCSGVDKGGAGIVLAENDEVLVVQWPAGKHWVGRGMKPAYHAASTDVLKKDDDGRFTLLISWESRRNQQRALALQEAEK